MKGSQGSKTPSPLSLILSLSPFYCLSRADCALREACDGMRRRRNVASRNEHQVGVREGTQEGGETYNFYVSLFVISSPSFNSFLL